MFWFGDHEYFWERFIDLLQLDILRDFGLLNSKNIKRFSFQSVQVPHNIVYSYFGNYTDCRVDIVIRKRHKRGMRIQDSQ